LTVATGWWSRACPEVGLTANPAGWWPQRAPELWRFWQIPARFRDFAQISLVSAAAPWLLIATRRGNGGFAVSRAVKPKSSTRSGPIFERVLRPKAAGVRAKPDHSGYKDKMRSSKSRSRSKPNRPRPVGNIVNRVFDSSGPEGKVRGTPQQIIEKYIFLARDAQLSNDRIAAENFNQHAEHYTRLLAEAQRELAAEQEARQSQQQQRDQQQRDQPRDQQRDQQPRDQQRDQQPRDQQRDQQPRDRQPREDRSDYRGDFRAGPRPDAQDNRFGEQRYDRHADVIDLSEAPVDDTGLIETPESRPRPTQARPFDPGEAAFVAPRSRGDAAPDAPAAEPAGSDVGRARSDNPPRRPRPPRKPRSEKPAGDDGKPASDGSSEAAE